MPPVAIKMHKSKFEIGEEIFFMEFNQPKKAAVIGISNLEGKVKFTGIEVDNQQGVITTYYHVGSYSSVEEKNAYSSKEELQKSLFDKL